MDFFISFLAKIDWSTNPEIIKGLPFRWYSMGFLISFVAGLFLMKNIFNKEGRNLKQLDYLFIAMFLGVILGARFGEVFYSWDEYKNAPIEIFLPVELIDGKMKFTGYRGLASHGAVVGILIALYFFWRKYKGHFLWIVDRITIPVAFGAIFVRLGNFFNHEIVGKVIEDPEKLPWATKFMYHDPNEWASNVYRHPAQLYESAFYFIVFLIMLFTYRRLNRKVPYGLMFGLFMLLVFGFRFLVEYVKETQNNLDAARLENLGLNTGQLLSIPMILTGIFFIFYSLKWGKKQLDAS